MYYVIIAIYEALLFTYHERYTTRFNVSYDTAIEVFINLSYLLYCIHFDILYFFVCLFFPTSDHQSVSPVGGAVTVGQMRILLSSASRQL